MKKDFKFSAMGFLFLFTNHVTCHEQWIMLIHNIYGFQMFIIKTFQLFVHVMEFAYVKSI